MAHDDSVLGGTDSASRRLMIPGLASGHATFHWIIQGFAVVLPEIQMFFGLNSVGAAGVMSARDLAAGLIALPGGVVVDVLRRYWGLLLAGCLALAALGSLLMGVSSGLLAAADRHRSGGHFPLRVASARLRVAVVSLCRTAGHGAVRPRRGRQHRRRGRPAGYRSAACLPGLAGAAEHLRHRSILLWFHGRLDLSTHRPRQHRVRQAGGPAGYGETAGTDPPIASQPGAVGADLRSRPAGNVPDIAGYHTIAVLR